MKRGREGKRGGEEEGGRERGWEGGRKRDRETERDEVQCNLLIVFSVAIVQEFDG